MIGLKSDWLFESKTCHYVVEDYEGALARWCPGCGDHAVLTSIQRLCQEEQLPPEKTVFVSGIGCSSRFPHYMKTYGFHGLHGRALPVAEGVKSRRPDLNVFVATGDGDCCSIGTAHWVHSIRYNMDMTVMLLDNRIYGLTKKQSSPTTHKGFSSNTHPRGAFLSPINPLMVTMAITNASFVARTVDWNPPHLHATLKAAYHHKGLSFIHIVQRCPHYLPTANATFQDNPDLVLMLDHADGIPITDGTRKYFKNQMQHDPRDRSEAFHVAQREDVLPIGLFYWNPDAERYDEMTCQGAGMTVTEKREAFEKEIQRFLI